MHADLELGGPVYWVLVAFMYGCGGLSLFVVIDALRARRAPAFAGNPLSKWYWFVPQAAYFALFVLMNVPVLELPAAAAAFVIATPFVLVAQVAYLLRVVYPAPGRLREGRMADVLTEVAAQETTPDTAPNAGRGE